MIEAFQNINKAFDIFQLFQCTGMTCQIAICQGKLFFQKIEISFLIDHQHSHNPQPDFAFECFINILESSTVFGKVIPYCFGPSVSVGSIFYMAYCSIYITKEGNHK